MIALFRGLSDDTLALRTWTVRDVEMLVKACNDSVLRDQLGVPSPYTERDAHEYVAVCAANWTDRTQFTFAVTNLADNGVVGSVRVGPSPWGATAGYWTAPWARQRHVASNALRLVTTWALEGGLSPIRLYIDPANLPSQRVASNVGYRRDEAGVILDLEGVPGDLVFVSPSLDATKASGDKLTGPLGV